MLKIFSRKTKNKTCAKCGKSFTCVVEDGCWCDKLTISRENLAKIRRLYMDCLCKDCLKEFETPSPSAADVS